MDFLLFDTPLTGSYEFSVEASVFPGAEAALTHNGLVIEPFRLGGHSLVYPIGRGEAVKVPWRLNRLNGFNRLTIQASPERVRYLVNGHLYNEDNDPSPTCPWLGLVSHGERAGAWRLFSLRGLPSIPREVRLTHGDRLEGWASSFSHESQPARWSGATPERMGNARQGTVTTAVLARDVAADRGSSAQSHVPVKLDDYDWAAADGIIHGRRLLAGNPAQQGATTNSAPVPPPAPRPTRAFSLTSGRSATAT